MIKIGIIGLSVHSADFTQIINQTAEGRQNCRVTQLYHPPGNPDVEFSRVQLERFQTVVTQHGVKMVNSIEAILPEVDCMMLLTNDGRPHLEEICPILKARKPVYVDKPMAESLKNVNTIFKEAAKYQVPVFTSSALRYVQKAQSIAQGAVGRVNGALTFGPAPLQKSHTDLFWDGIHGIELLYTVMGPGCEYVSRVYSPETDVVTGVWKDGRTGVFRGIRAGKVGFGGTVFGNDGIVEIGKFDGYEGLVDAILTFFSTGQMPVKPEETLELYAFMHAADVSKMESGRKVSIAEELAKVL